LNPISTPRRSPCAKHHHRVLRVHRVRPIPALRRANRQAAAAKPLPRSRRERHRQNLPEQAPHAVVANLHHALPDPQAKQQAASGTKGQSSDWPFVISGPCDNSSLFPNGIDTAQLIPSYQKVLTCNLGVIQRPLALRSGRRLLIARRTAHVCSSHR